MENGYWSNFSHQGIVPCEIKIKGNISVLLNNIYRILSKHIWMSQ